MARIPSSAMNPATSISAHAMPVGWLSASAVALSPNSNQTQRGARSERPIRSIAAVSATPPLTASPLGVRLAARKIAVGVQAARIPATDSQPAAGSNSATAAAIRRASATDRLARRAR